MSAPTHDLCEVTITAPDGDWLEELCHQLIARRLAASAHVIHDIASTYRWHGSIHKTREARAFLRSRTELLDDLTAYVVKRHPYDIPNITAFPIIAGNPDYLDWIRTETTHRDPIAADTTNDIPEVG